MKEKSAQDESQKSPELSGHWKQVQTAIWLIGLALLAWRGWWWPGILVLVAISGLTEAALQWYSSKQQEEATARAEEQEAMRERVANLPEVCPNCGGPISEDTVVWSGPSSEMSSSMKSGSCPFCGSSVTGAKRSVPSSPLPGSSEPASSEPVSSGKDGSATENI